jgi:NarL family two-component system response regulator LiaR
MNSICETFNVPELVTTPTSAGYLLKDSAPKDLVQAIFDVHRGETPLHPAVLKVLVGGLKKEPQKGNLVGRLTDREIEVLKLVAKGLSDKKIAKALSLSSSTVASHISNTLEKLELSNRTQLALYALKTGISQLDV